VASLQGRTSDFARASNAISQAEITFRDAYMLICRLQDTVRRQRQDLRRLQPIVPLLVPLANVVIPGVRRLIQTLEGVQRSRRRPKKGTVVFMRQVHELRKKGLKWEVVHNRMKKTPGYRMKSSETLRQCYSRFMKDLEHARMVTD
jgi:hypothetical protein